MPRQFVERVMCVLDRTRSVAAARATLGARREGGDTEVEEERRRRNIGAVEWRRDMGFEHWL